MNRTLKTYISRSLLVFILFFSFEPVLIHAETVLAYTGESQNWAGYVATGGPYTSVSSTWTIPLTYSSTDEKVSAEWVGIGGIESNDLIQVGTEEIARDNRVDYVAWYEALPENPVTIPLAMHAGDSVTASLNFQGGSSMWFITLRDNTTGETFSTSINYNSSFSSVEWIEERPRIGEVFLPLADFGTVVFTEGRAIQNGVTQSLVDLGVKPIIMAMDGKVLASPSNIGSDRSTFSVTMPGSNHSTPTNSSLVPIANQNMSVAPAPNTNQVSSSVVTTPSSISVTSGGDRAEALKVQILEAIIVRLKQLINQILIQRGLPTIS